MESFEELGVTPELVEALAAEGIETPTAFQAMAIPVLLRRNALLAAAGPGAGTLIAYGVPLLQNTDADATAPEALVLAPTPERASSLAESLSRLAVVTGHRIAALGSPWALPELAGILFATPEDLLREVRASRAPLEGIQAVVVDGFGTLTSGGKEALNILFESLPKEGLRVLFSQPMGPDSEEFGKAHFHRAIHLPPKAAQKGASESSPSRGEVFYRLAEGSKEEDALVSVAAGLGASTRHVLLFLQTEDQAADIGDFLAIHGYMAGPPGDENCPVWLSAEELKGRKVLDEWSDPDSVLAVSVDVPADPDSLDRRHGGRESGLILVRSRELPHLKDVAQRTGYRLVPAREPLPTRVAGELERLRDALVRVLREDDLAPHYLALEPLFEQFSPGEIAAAALLLLQRRPESERGLGVAGSGESIAERAGGPPPKTWVRLFVAVGEKEDIGPGDLLGAIAGEAGVEGSQVGKIEIRETFSLVEVNSEAADRVIKGLNGTTIKGRSVRADYDRGGPKGRGGTGSRKSGGDRGSPPQRGETRGRPRRKLMGDPQKEPPPTE